MTNKQIAEQLRLALNLIVRGNDRKAYMRIKPVYDYLIMEAQKNGEKRIDLRAEG